MVKESSNSVKFARMSGSGDTIFRDFDLGDAAKREEQLDQIHRRIFRRLAHDVAHRGGHGRVEQHAAGLQSGEIHAHCLPRLKRSHNSPRMKVWACCPWIANGIEQFVKSLGSAGILLAIFQSSTLRKEAGGTPTLLEPAHLHVNAFRKLSRYRNSAFVVSFHDAGYYAAAWPFLLIPPRRRRSCIL